MMRLASSLMASTVRGWRGTMSIVRERQPEKMLVLYDLEACPYCRPVRECLTALDLDALIYPCPKGSEHYWDKVKALGGKKQVPYLDDPNTGARLYESRDIVAYLYEYYGESGKTRPPRFDPFATVTSMLATGVRTMAGLNYRASIKPAQPLVLYSFESSPYSRLVRERLCERAIPYVLRNLGKQQTADLGPPALRFTLSAYEPLPGTKRAAMREQTGRVQVPYLIDPNTGRSMFESAHINRYLDETYGET